MKFEQSIGSLHAKEFIEKIFSQYDTTQLLALKIAEHNSQKETIGRFVFYRNKKKPSIYINLKTNPNFYPYNFSTFARNPDEESRQGWISAPYSFELETLDEAIVFISMAYFFSYLSKKRLIKDIDGSHIKDVIANQSWFAENRLAEFRAYIKEKKAA